MAGFEDSAGLGSASSMMVIDGDSLLPLAPALLNAQQPGRRFYWRIKRPVDFAGSLIAIFLAAPAMLIITLILARQGRPILIRRRRLGLMGRPFSAYTFRTMLPHPARAFGGPAAEEIETNAFGRLLLRTRLDRLPMLWNVLKGDMNLVGPRPLTQEELCGSGRAARRTLSVRPGLTGLWWLDGEPDLRRRLALDRTYIEHAGPMMDLRIVLRTLVMMHRDAPIPSQSADLSALPR